MSTENSEQLDKLEKSLNELEVSIKELRQVQKERIAYINTLINQMPDREAPPRNEGAFIFFAILIGLIVLGAFIIVSTA